MFQRHVGSVVDKVLLVPDEHRSFSTGIDEATRLYGIDAETMENLLDVGLPCIGTGPDLLFDALDLQNIGLDLRLPSSQWAGMRLWSRSLRSSRHFATNIREVGMDCKCPEPGHEGSCDFKLSSRMADHALTTKGAPKDGKILLEAHLSDRSYDFGAAFDPVVGCAQELRFHKLTENLAGDPGFLRETKLADCRSASRHLVRLATEAGFVARPASGIFIGVPYPILHVWFEVEIDSSWIAADPFFLHNLQQWGILRVEDWPLSHSPRNVLWRLNSTYEMNFPLAFHRGQGIPVGMTARVAA
ncbi:transglutaminase domain-containing protein [Streptomyces sp. NPDC060184]|uniref:transglutaminase domain-containing protein n=1 Tax=Streptomyces sp. NPDC060184 TaxID=3347064 RepID=UPI0036628794